MTNSANTSGSNFPANLPKVGVGDPVTFAPINMLSKAVMRNTVVNAIGGVTVRRGTGGTSIVSQRGFGEPHPFRVGIDANGDEKKVKMFTGNVWSGQNSTMPINILFPVSQENTTEVPVGEFDTASIASCTMNTGFPPIFFWDFDGGDKWVWIYYDGSSDKAELRYTAKSAFDTAQEGGAVCLPIAYLDSDGNTFQIIRSDIWLDPMGLATKAKHPFQVYKISNGKYKVEQGMAFSYPNSFIDVGNGVYPNAIKLGATLGGTGYLLNESNNEFSASDGDIFFLMFTRDGVTATSDYEASRVGDFGGWKCTFEKATTLPADDIHGNYNTELTGACGDTMPPCGPPTYGNVTIGPFGLFPVTYQKRNVKFFSYGTVAYPVAKIIGGKVVQLLRSDFTFYPPLDARMSFMETTLSTIHHQHDLE